MTKKPVGKGMQGKLSNHAKLWPYNEPGKDIVMLPVRTISEMPHCIPTKMQLSGRLCRAGDNVDVYAEMIKPLEYKYAKKEFLENNKHLIKKEEKTKIEIDKENTERIKAFYIAPINPKATSFLWMNGFTPKRKEQTPHIMADGWRR